jgi:hypothetical protein
MSVKKTSKIGIISLLDKNKTFVTSKKYKNVNERRRIVQKWIDTYRLQDRIFYIEIKPEFFTLK